MLEKLVENQVLFYCAGVTIFLGIIIKGIVGISLKRLVRAASNMSKSNHSLMRLVRAKFEHACMVSDKVQNVTAFVDKYLYEYKVWGISLHFLRHMEKTMIWLCGIVSLWGGAMSYYIEKDVVAAEKYGMIGGGGILFLVLLQVTLTEQIKLDAARMYMVDFLENTYAHRYEKIEKPQVEEKEEAPHNQVVVEAKKEVHKENVENRIPLKPKEEPELQPVQADKIREILEEFLA